MPRCPWVEPSQDTTRDGALIVVSPLSPGEDELRDVCPDFRFQKLFRNVPDNTGAGLTVNSHGDRSAQESFHVGVDWPVELQE